MGVKLENAIYTGDNLYWLRRFPDEFVDLIYIDPPWCTNRKYNLIFKDSKEGLFNLKDELFAYVDMWEGRDASAKLCSYIDYMTPRVRELSRVLKPTGSIYLHCDWHANAHLRLMMDRIFGPNNFQNEIIWAYKSGGATKKRFSRKHDIILFYSKGKNYLFNPQKEKSYNREFKRYNFKGVKEYQDRVGWYTIVNMKDVWHIDMVGRTSNERMGYPTQKPEALLEKIIKASSNEGDVVLDAFCGCGTASVVTYKLKRKFLGIDRSPRGCRIIRGRLKKVGSYPDMVNLNFDKKMSWQEAQQWYVSYIGGTISSKLSGDHGIDGLTMSGNPISVKHWSNPVNDSIVAEFISKGMYYAKKKTGYVFSTNGFTESARRRVKEARKDDLIIKLFTPEQVEEIADKSFYTNLALEDIFT